MNFVHFILDTKKMNEIGAHPMITVKSILNSINKDVIDCRNIVRQRNHNNDEKDSLIQALQHSNKSLQNELSTFANELYETKEMLGRIHEELSISYEEQLDALNSEVDRVVSQCNSCEEANMKLRSKISELLEENSELKDRLNEQQTTKIERKTAVVGLNNEVEDLKKQLTEVKEYCNMLETAHAEISTFQQERGHAAILSRKAENATLIKEISELRIRMSEIELENSRLNTLLKQKDHKSTSSIEHELFATYVHEIRPKQTTPVKEDKITTSSSKSRFSTDTSNVNLLDLAGQDDEIYNYMDGMQESYELPDEESSDYFQDTSVKYPQLSRADKSSIPFRINSTEEDVTMNFQQNKFTSYPVQTSEIPELLTQNTKNDYTTEFQVERYEAKEYIADELTHYNTNYRNLPAQQFIVQPLENYSFAEPSYETPGEGINPEEHTQFGFSEVIGFGGFPQEVMPEDYPEEVLSNDSLQEGNDYPEPEEYLQPDHFSNETEQEEENTHRNIQDNFHLNDSQYPNQEEQNVHNHCLEDNLLTLKENSTDQVILDGDYCTSDKEENSASKDPTLEDFDKIPRFNKHKNNREGSYIENELLKMDDNKLEQYSDYSEDSPEKIDTSDQIKNLHHSSLNNDEVEENGRDAQYLEFIDNSGINLSLVESNAGGNRTDENFLYNNETEVTVIVPPEQVQNIENKETTTDANNLPTKHQNDIHITGDSTEDKIEKIVSLELVLYENDFPEELNPAQEKDENGSYSNALVVYEPCKTEENDNTNFNNTPTQPLETPIGSPKNSQETQFQQNERNISIDNKSLSGDPGELDDNAEQNINSNDEIQPRDFAYCDFAEDEYDSPNELEEI